MEVVHPTSIGKYEVLSVIGHGGMGVVYRAQDPLIGRQVAIKTVTQNLRSDPGMLKRFYGEAEKMGMLRHPNIITVYDLGEHNDLPYIVMEYVEGDPLDRVIAKGKEVSLFEKLRIIEQLCAALAYAHQNEVLHRDVKPANVIVRPDGIAKLLDFGIARQDRTKTDEGLTAVGGVIGTVSYMAPERLRGIPDRPKGGLFDGRSDIFSTGVLLFQLLTGNLPFLGKEYVLINQLLSEPHPPLSDFLHDYPPVLDDIVDRALKKDPSERYQSADEMGSELYSVISSLREQHVSELFALANELTEKEDFVNAQMALYRLLKIDEKNVHARSMVRELGLRVSQKARIAQAEELHRDAGIALRDRDFTKAIELLEQATQLAPQIPAIAERLQYAKAKKQTSDQVLGYLQQADRAKRGGDLTGARLIVEKAMQLDTENSRLRVAYQALVRQVETAAEQEKFRANLLLARRALDRNDFDAVMQIVQQAELVNPGDLELQELTSAAQEGIFQQRRNAVLQELEELIANITTEADAEGAERRLEQCLGDMPNDATLLRYQIQIERALGEFRIRRQVDDTLRRCAAIMKSDPRRALEYVKLALNSTPTDERLVTLEVRIQQQISRVELETAQSTILGEAREAMRLGDFLQAVSILQACRPPVLSGEITQLLEYARQQLSEAEQQQFIARIYRDAELLLGGEKYQDCIVLLAPVVQTTQDARLGLLLDKARIAIDHRNSELAAALDLLRPYYDTGCFEHVLAIIARLPPYVSMASEVETLRLDAKRNGDSESFALNTIGHAYGSLAHGQVQPLSIDRQQTSSNRLVSAFADLFDRRVPS